MYKIGINSISLDKEWPQDFSDFIKKAAGLGFEAIELFTAFLVEKPKYKLDEYRKIAKDLGIELQFSTGLGKEHDLSSEDEAIRQNGIEHVKKTLEIIKYMNGSLFPGLIMLHGVQKLTRQVINMLVVISLLKVWRK